MHRKHVLTTAVLAALFLSACGGSDQDEEASKASQMAEDAKAMAQEAAEETKAAAQDLGEAAESAMNDAQAAAGNAMDEAGAAMDEASAAASEMMDEASAAAENAMDEAGAAAENAMDEASAAMDEAGAAAGDAMDSMNEAAAALVGAAAFTAAAAASDDDDCTLGIEVGDNIAYSSDTLSAPSSCSEVTVAITHTGQLPAMAMGHNWVLVPEDALQSIAQAGAAAGADANYVPDDDRIIAATAIVGGGESDSVRFSLDALEEGVTYRYVCTFPGHWAVMQGTFTVSG